MSQMREHVAARDIDLGTLRSNISSTQPERARTRQELMVMLQKIRAELATHNTHPPRQSFDSQIEQGNRLMRAVEQSASARQDIVFGWLYIKKGLPSDPNGVVPALNMNSDPDRDLIRQTQGLKEQLEGFEVEANLLEWVATGAKTASMRCYSRGEWKKDTHFWAVGPRCPNQLICISEVQTMTFGNVSPEMIARENLPCEGPEQLVIAKIILRRVLSFFRRSWVEDNTQVCVLYWKLESRAAAVV